MDASCKIQRSIHVFRLVYKYVSRILGTYQKDNNFKVTRRGVFLSRDHSANDQIINS